MTKHPRSSPLIDHSIRQRLNGKIRKRTHSGGIPHPARAQWEWRFEGQQKRSAPLYYYLEDALLLPLEMAQTWTIRTGRDRAPPRRAGTHERIGILSSRRGKPAYSAAGLYADRWRPPATITLIEPSSLRRTAATKAADEACWCSLSRRARSSRDRLRGRQAGKDLSWPDRGRGAHRRFRVCSKGSQAHPAYVIERRVRRAKELLGNGTLPIAENPRTACAASPNQSHLNRLFEPPRRQPQLR